MNNPTNERHTYLGIIFALLIGIVCLALVAEVILRLAMPHWQEFYNGRFMRILNVKNHGLVATGIPGFDGYFSQNNGDFRVRLQINDFGYRNTKPIEKSEGSVWFVGDSMAFGWGVEQNEMYSSLVENMINFPTFNIASPGTDVCGYQALLARTLKHASPRAIIVGLILENDLADYNCLSKKGQTSSEVVPTIFDRNLLNIKGLKVFLIQNSALYNFLAVSLKRVRFINEMLIQFGLVAQGHTYRPANIVAGFDRVINKTATELINLKSQVSTNTPFAVLIAPARFEIKDRDSAFQDVREKMVYALAERNISVIDPIKEFLDAGFKKTHFAHDGHWSALGHKIAAQVTADWLRSQKIDK